VSDFAAFSRTERRGVLVSASDAGLCYGVNEAVRQVRDEGLVTSASLLVVAPFARDAVRRLGPKLGVQLALNAEHEMFEMRPVTYAPSLFGGRGGFPVEAADAAEHADPEEVIREFRAQIERAKILGVVPTFLASHDDVVARHLALFDVFLELAEEYQLPIRHGYTFAGTSLDAARLARERGHFVAERTVNWTGLGGESLEELFEQLPEGVTEIIVSPAVAGDELSAVLSDAERRVATLAALRAAQPRVVAQRHGIAWLSWDDLHAS